MNKRISLVLVLALCLSLLAACGGADKGVAPVESVALLTGAGSVGLSSQYAGVVVAQDTVNVEKDADKKVSERKVEAGDTVAAGDVLFTYDTEQMELDLQKLDLELEQLRNSIETMQSQKAELEQQKSWASSSQQLEYTIQIQELETNIKEAEFNIKAKQVDIERLTNSMDVTEVTAPVDGTVQSVNENGVDAQGNTAAYMVITETGSFRVKGLVNELNAGSMTVGLPVSIRSRTDATMVWAGTVTNIDWDTPANSGNNGMYYATDEMTTSTRYPFYVELASMEGLLLGQHVYIEPGTGAPASEGLWLPEYYVVSPENEPYVWAENGRGLLEQREVSLGGYNEETCAYEILDGLTAEDWIAFPEETLTAGMTAEHYNQGGNIDPEGGAVDEGGISTFTGSNSGVSDGKTVIIGSSDGIVTVEEAG